MIFYFRPDLQPDKKHIKLKCVASIYDAYYKVNEISAERVRKPRKNNFAYSTGIHKTLKWSTI
jgi:hypothetical protein